MCQADINVTTGNLHDMTLCYCLVTSCSSSQTSLHSFFIHSFTTLQSDIYYLLSQLHFTLMQWYFQWCGLRPSVLGQDRSGTKKIGLGLGLACLVLCCETRSCRARRHNDFEGHSNFSSTIYSFSFLCLEHRYCGDQQRRSLKT